MLVPHTANMQFLALLMIGNVSVILSGGNLGESVRDATLRAVSLRSGWPGNSEHV